MICAEVSSQLSDKNIHPIHFHATERNPHSAAELDLHPAAPACRFNEVEDFWKPGPKDIMDKTESVGLDDLLPLIKSKKGVMTTGYCQRHKCQCSLRPTKVHIAGTSCVDFSSIRKGKLNQGKQSCRRSSR